MTLTSDASDDVTRCAVCSAPLNAAPGCVRGGCTQQPPPRRFYSVPRACVEYQEMIVDDGVAHRFFAA
jgi:hypothetical protein